MAEDEELPEELEDQCEDCHKALTEIERLLNPLLSTSKAQSEEKVSPFLFAALVDFSIVKNTPLQYWSDTLVWAILDYHFHSMVFLLIHQAGINTPPFSSLNWTVHRKLSSSHTPLTLCSGVSQLVCCKNVLTCPLVELLTLQFAVYLVMKGIDPKTHLVKQELVSLWYSIVLGYDSLVWPSRLPLLQNQNHFVLINVVQERVQKVMKHAQAVSKSTGRLILQLVSSILCYYFIDTLHTTSKLEHWLLVRTHCNLRQ